MITLQMCFCIKYVLMREIVLDTETTGLDAESGDRIIEVGCIELYNKIRTGKVFHKYINPEREIPYSSTKIHGLTKDFLKEKPKFTDIARELTEFLDDSPLVIHNAAFDMRFLNMELRLLNISQIEYERTADTLLIARKKFPGSPVSLDALCKRFSIDLSERKKHGALLDAELLAMVYLELMGGAQSKLGFNAENEEGDFVKNQIQTIKKPIRSPRLHAPTKEEMRLHEELMSKISIIT